MNDDAIPFAAVPDAAARPRRVLIVDDHPLIRATVRSLLEREAPLIEVVGIAEDGAAAIRMASEEAPDIVLLDLDLGDEYGLDLIPAIAGQRGAAIIILTASDSPRVRRLALAAGADDFVSKLSPAKVLIASVLAARCPAVPTGVLSRAGGTALPGKQVEGSAGAGIAND
jgi:DNA-binding NarL/FixJ family response regulator